MRLINLLCTATLATLTSSALAGGLPSCSSTSATPCSCPNGTTYRESATFAIIGAAAKDVTDLISDFYKTSWLGVVPFETHGPDNQAGSYRTSHFPTLVGTYTISELLTKFETYPDGSFIEQFEQLPSTVPVEYTTGNGSFSGYYVTLTAKRIFEYETSVRWSIYACETAYPRNFKEFHEGALNNATSILQAEGKVRGINAGPYSVQSFTVP